MPANSAYLLRRFLDTLRLNGRDDLFQIESESMAGYQEMMASSDYDRLHLQVLGYRPWLFSNLAPLFFILVTFVAVWVIAIIAQLCVGKPEERRPNLAIIMQMSSNFLARLIYLSFLEVLICALLSLSLNLDQLDMIYATVILVTLGVLMLVILLRGGKATMHPARTYEAHKDISVMERLCCWTARRLRGELDPELTKEGLQSFANYEKRQ